MLCYNTDVDLLQLQNNNVTSVIGYNPFQKVSRKPKCTKSEVNILIINNVNPTNPFHTPKNIKKIYILYWIIVLYAENNNK